MQPELETESGTGAEMIPCCASSPRPWASVSLPMPGLADAEGPRLPEALPEVIDAHVHLFPDRVFDAIWRWFSTNAWPIRYPLYTPAVIRFLLDRGVSHLVALTYAHRPGMARMLNAYMAEVCRQEPRVIGLGTVLPGEPDAEGILAEAFALGLRGVKLHCHVQCVAPDDERLRPLYELCAEAGKPLVIHAGREPSSSAYRCDPYELCAAERIERVLRDHPRLRLCVPHLGADEFAAYERLVTRYDNLWLDTTMAIGDFFPLSGSGVSPLRMVGVRPERMMYGTDFPGLPYAWDREVKKLVGADLGEEALAAVLGGTARQFFGVGPVVER